MPGEITKKQIDKMRKEFESDSSARVAQKAVTSNNLSSVTLRRDLVQEIDFTFCLLYTSPSPRDRTRSRMPSSA